MSFTTALGSLVITLVLATLGSTTAGGEPTNLDTVAGFDRSSEDPTKACFEVGGIVMDGSKDCGTVGVFEAKCNDWCSGVEPEIGEAFDFDDWDAFGGDSVDQSIQRADRLRNQLNAESAMKVADAEALRMRLRAHGERLLAIADLHLEHARDLQKQKDGPSAKALRAYKSAWKAASKSAKELLDATDDDDK